MAVDLANSVVRVLDAEGNTCGAGFLVARDLAVTCAHVIKRARAGPGGCVRLAFHIGGEPVEAKVLPDGYYPGEDVAFLRLLGVHGRAPLPEGVRPAVLGLSDGREGTGVRAFGYPHVGQVEGLWGTGELAGQVNEAGRLLLQLRSSEITAGFSGGPVWDADTGQVVGMVTQIAIPDRYGRLDEVAFAISAETLRDLRPEEVTLVPPPKAALLAAYRRRVLEETRLVDLAGIPLPRDRDGRPIPLKVPLDRVYIRIQAMPELRQREVQEEERQALEKQAADQQGFLGRLLGRRARETPPHHPTATDALAVLRTLGEYFYRRGEVYQAEERPEPVDPEAALREHRRLVILGAPGAGKTTLLRYLARRAAEDEEAPVPVLVSLRDYATYRGAGGQQSLRDFALDWAARGDGRLRRVLEEAAGQEKVLWLVDALDEARGWRGEAAREAAALPGRMVLTSRPVGYERAGLENLPHFEVLPLTPMDTDRFLRNWFGVLAERRGEGEEWMTARVEWLREQLTQRPRIQPLTRNPLLLTFLVVLAGEEPARDMPVTRAELYRQYIRELLLTWEYRRRPKAGVEGRPALRLGPLEGEEAKQAALEGLLWLGWRLHLTYYGGQVQELPEREVLVDYLAGLLCPRWGLSGGEAKTVAEAVLAFWEEAGLLAHWRLGGRDYLAFRHLTFQEYAAARTLADLWEKD